MNGLPKPQRIRVIQKFAEATLQNGDILRDLFIKRLVQPDLALRILCATPEECRAIAQEYKLYIRNKSSQAPWQVGCSTIQRRAIMQRLRLANIENDDIRRYKLLEQHNVPQGYGLKLIQAKDEKFARMMETLLGDGPLLL
ncbi:hypothetical protein CBS101457_000167 [Exobasidium rhododendri]|nr:hypothetical protein CBS101457_000167 [Exobasidium rhododendri]